MFILVTSQVDQLLATVRSRCSVVRFARLGAAEIAAVLERDYGKSPRDAAGLAASADGNLRRAIEGAGGAWTATRSAAGRFLRDTRTAAEPRARIAQAAELLKPARPAKGGGPAAAEREHLGTQLDALASMLRDLGIIVTGADPALLCNLDLRDDLVEVANAYDADRALRAFEAVRSAHDALDRNVSPKVVADWLSLQL
jgi:DNA polymerase-3 subunit delta'